MPPPNPFQPKIIGEHKTGCTASAAVRAGKRKNVWMTPELVDHRLIFVCADAGCQAKLVVLNVLSLRLPRF
jgi:hypothetical protein